MKKRYLILLLFGVLMSCGPKKGIVTRKKKESTSSERVVVKKESKTKPVVPSSQPKVGAPTKRATVDVYIETYSDIAKSQMRQFKIPASITLAQGILESGSGNGRLAVKANNHFGIKCHGWKGAKIYHDDDEDQECFRKYRNPETSYKDHSEFLTGRKRYSKLFKLKPNDYKGWARGLKAAGYATDRKYPQKLISLIERYELYKYDNQVLGKITDVIVSQNENTHTVIKGDTLYSLSRYYGVSVDKLKADNNLNSNDLAIGQVLKIISD